MSLPRHEQQEHQVVVVFDVTAPDRITAHERFVEAFALDGSGEGFVNQIVQHAMRIAGVESWWLPEPDVKHLDGNDNAGMKLVAVEGPS